ncbi:hypothetical protein A6A07_11355 [Streptomyces sp. CB03911]|nr:hypothetical protein A6A07_11355 [Streptomyces sp. CB03911]
MAADAFTQIRNALFRDTRLSFRDKGVFGLISTHRDGYGVSAESIAACSPTDGITAIKTSLRNLETLGYLQRTRLRNTNGTLGGAVYFITDQPESAIGALELENRRSEPAVAEPTQAEPTLGQPTVAEPAVAQPTVADLPHKKNNSKHTSRKKTLSPPQLPRQAAVEPPVDPEERENDLFTGQAARVLAAYEEALGRPLFGDSRSKLLDDAAERLAAGVPLAWLCDRARELVANGWTDLAKHCDRSTVPTVRKAVDSRSDWCGHCQDPNHRMRKDPARDNELVPCDDCHPAAVARRIRTEAGEAA